MHMFHPFACCVCINNISMSPQAGPHLWVADNLRRPADTSSACQRPPSHRFFSTTIFFFTGTMESLDEGRDVLPLEDIEDVINHIEFRSGVAPEDAEPRIVHMLPGPGPDDFITEREVDTMFEEDAVYAIKRYLRGRGHPDHRDMRCFLGNDIFARDADDALLRARFFLRCLTGEEVIRCDRKVLVCDSSLVSTALFISSPLSSFLQIHFRHRGNRGDSGYDHMPVPRPVSPSLIIRWDVPD